MRTTGRLSQKLVVAGLGPLLIAVSVTGMRAEEGRAVETQKQRDKRMAWWRKAKFGYFINFGLYSIPAGQWKGKPVGGIGEWIMHSARIPISEYEKLAPQFNPTRYDPAQWVRLAKAAGTKYLVFDVKHHDGFCLYDTRYTDWNVMKATPFKRDFLKELSAECKRQGIVFCVYYSILDWHNPDYLPRVTWDSRPTEGHSYEKHVELMKYQLREILTNYGRIGVIWFDGGWEHDAKGHHSEEIVKMMRELQPGLIINDRIGIPQDFSTPEQFIPAAGLRDRDWETCMTINDTWGYKSDDHNWKSTETLLRNLVDIVSKGGNFLLNVGPTGEGEIPSSTVERLLAMGKWLKVNGESIYGTTASPFKKLTWGRCTRKRGKLYLHVFDWPKGALEVPGLKNHVNVAYLLADRKRSPLAVKRSGDNVSVMLPETPPDPVDTVVVLEIEGQPEVLPPVLAQETDGTIQLRAIDAEIHGTSPQYESGGGKDNIGYWGDPRDWVSWDFQVMKPGAFNIEIAYSCARGFAGSQYVISVANQSLEGKTEETGEWNKFVQKELGCIRVDKPGKYTLAFKPKLEGWRHIGLQAIVFKPVAR